MASEARSSVTALPADTERLTAFDRTLAGLLARGLDGLAARLVFWDGSEIATSASPPKYRVRIASRRTLARLLANPQLWFGESYADGTVEIEGSLPDLMADVFLTTGEPRGLRTAIDRATDQLRRIDPKRSFENVHHHYDLGNDFYSLWLDRRMLYTCAYFPTPGTSLEDAQVAKMDHVCRKLRLRPGERVIEAGCGWGALALHMAGQYGVRVRAFNLSSEQIAYARDLAARVDLGDRVEFIEDDYRSASGKCDAFVSVGMLEHVGRKSYRELGRVVRRVLEPNGRGFVHSIGRDRPAPVNAWIRRRIFPGCYTPSLAEMMEIFEPNALAVVDVENLRAHYARTLEHWLERYEQAVPAVRRMFDERFVRTWRLYLAGSIAAFRTGSMQLFQVLFTRGAASTALPETRADIYAA